MGNLTASAAFFDRYCENAKVDIYTRIMNAPRREFKKSCQRTSSQVITKKTRRGKFFTVEDVNARRERRRAYIATVCDLVKRVNNSGFTLSMFLDALTSRNVEDITVYRHNDLVETFTACAFLHGIVFFRTQQDVYYVDDTHASFWGLERRPRECVIAAGAMRGISQVMRKRGCLTYHSRVVRKVAVQDVDVKMHLLSY